jgi:L-lactate dehydrogenase complex protein LldF
MPDSFHLKIKEAIANPSLQAALDANAERRIAGRTVALNSLPEDPALLRQRAHDLRARTIANLDEYLEEFIASARANGMVVHQAADSREAVQIVLEIARQKGVKLVAKSKTMVGEEIELNEALEADGLQVVETDLGEYIVQIRKERPSHIITPAVHLRREEVGRTFHEVLGIPMTTDIPEMTAAARRVLRQTFLTADMGISGVNFAVAETGSLCMVTNEGNGRMVTTLPRLHVALLGIERLVPKLEDLVLVLALLPRYATGQKITVYTSLMNGPRRQGDADGPQERHVILVDNGRSAIRSSPLSDILMCIRCGSCLNACPVFRELGGHAYTGKRGEPVPYPGPVGSVVSPALFGQSEFGQLARASSLCGACKEACPVDIDLPKLLLRVRAGGLELRPERAKGNIPASLQGALKGFSWLATRPILFRAAESLAGFASRLVPPFSGWLRLPALSGWGFSKDFPCPSVRPFRARWQGLSRETGEGIPPVSTISRPEQGGAPDASQSVHSKGPLASAFQSSPGRSELIERFIDELNALGGSVERVSAGELPEAVARFLHERGASAILAWDWQYLPPGLQEALAQAGIRVLRGADPLARAGITGALGAVAETGTLILPGGPGRPQAASLLPELHVAVLKGEAVYATLDEALHLTEICRAPTTVLVSGPSRTADIEMTLTIGVHGPGQVHVFLVDP